MDEQATDIAPRKALPALLAATARYVAIVFGLGFFLGTIRLLAVAPLIGATAAVALELPAMLLASFVIARQSMALHRIETRRDGLLMGLLAFLLLMATEAALAYALNGQSPARWAASLIQTPGWLGLIGQTGFGLFPPLLALRRIVPPSRRRLPPLRH